MIADKLMDGLGPNQFRGALLQPFLVLSGPRAFQLALRRYTTRGALDGLLIQLLGCSTRKALMLEYRNQGVPRPIGTCIL